MVKPKRVEDALPMLQVDGTIYNNPEVKRQYDLFRYNQHQLKKKNPTLFAQLTIPVVRAIENYDKQMRTLTFEFPTAEAFMERRRQRRRT